MTIATFTEHFCTELWKSSVRQVFTFEAFKPYLVSTLQMKRLQEADSGVPLDKLSSADPVFKPRIEGRSPNDQHVLLYNGCGGMGDQMMTWPVSKILSEEGYHVHILSDPQADFCWFGLPWVRSITYLPCYWEWMERFDCHFIFEMISNSYIHEKQAHPVDLMLAKCGIDPATIAPERKRVQPRFTELERHLADSLYPGEKLGFFQVGASQTCRSVPLELAKQHLIGLAEAYPDIHWIALHGGKSHREEVAEFDFELPNAECRTFQNMRILWALLSRAEVCVAPDSMLIHAAGCMDAPCVGLWGTYPPESRVKYYSKHHALFPQEECEHAPCCNNAKSLPHFCPVPDKDGYCKVVSAITTGQIVEAVGRARRQVDSALNCAQNAVR